MVTIDEARSQINAARQQIQQQQEQANQVGAELTSIQSLRKAKNIQDVQYRKVNLQRVGEYKQALQSNEEEVSAYESEVNKAQAEKDAYDNAVRQAQIESQAQEEARQAFIEGKRASIYRGTPVYKYLNEYYETYGEGTQAKNIPQYTDSLGQGISIAPELAEKQIKAYNEWAATQQSIDPNIVKNRENIKAILTSPQPTLEQVKEYYESLPKPTPKPYRDLSFKDVELSFEAIAGNPNDNNKVNPLTFVSQKAQEGVNYLGRQVVQAYGIKGFTTVEKYQNPIINEQNIAFGVLSPTLMPESAFLKATSKVVPIKEGQVIRQEVTDEAGNVFVIERTAPKIKPRFIAREEIIPVIKDGEQVNVGTVTIERTTPPRYANVEERGIRSIFFSDKQIELNPLRVDIAKSNKIITNEAGEIINDAFIRQKRQGANVYSYYSINGKQIQLSQEELAKLPEPFRKQFKDVFPVTSSEEKLSAGEVRLKKVMTVSPRGEFVQLPITEKPMGKGIVTIPNKGKTTTVGSVVGKAKPVLETPEFTIYETKMGVKDVSLPKFRNVDNNIYIKGKSKVWKTPVVINDESGNVLMKTLEVGQKTKQTFANVQVAAAKTMPKVQPNIPKSVRPINQEITPSEVIVTSAVTPAVSEFYGKGQYERTDEVQSPQFLQAQSSEQILKSRPELRIKTEQKLQTNLKENNLLKPEQSLKEDQLLKQNTPQIIELKQLQQLKQIQLEKSLQKPQQIQTQPKQIIKNPNRVVILPKPKLLNVPRSNGILSKVKRAFDVVVWKKGQESVIGKDLPEGKAKRLGVTKVLSTLRASFKLRPSGTTTQEDINYKVPSQWFKPSKVDSERYVQVKNTRFGSGKETKEAQVFRKQKARRIKWF